MDKSAVSNQTKSPTPLSIFAITSKEHNRSPQEHVCGTLNQFEVVLFLVVLVWFVDFVYFFYYIHSTICRHFQSRIGRNSNQNMCSLVSESLDAIWLDFNWNLVWIMRQTRHMFWKRKWIIVCKVLCAFN